MPVQLETVMCVTDLVHYDFVLLNSLKIELQNRMVENHIICYIIMYECCLYIMHISY